MVIRTELTVNGYKATLEPKLRLYQGDIVFVEFTLINSIISAINVFIRGINKITYKWNKNLK